MEHKVDYYSKESEFYLLVYKIYYIRYEIGEADGAFCIDRAYYI